MMPISPLIPSEQKAPRSFGERERSTTTGFVAQLFKNSMGAGMGQNLADWCATSIKLMKCWQPYGGIAWSGQERLHLQSQDFSHPDLVENDGLCVPTKFPGQDNHQTYFSSHFHPRVLKKKKKKSHRGVGEDGGCNASSFISKHIFNGLKKHQFNAGPGRPQGFIYLIYQDNLKLLRICAFFISMAHSTNAPVRFNK